MTIIIFPTTIPAPLFELDEGAVPLDVEVVPLDDVDEGLEDEEVLVADDSVALLRVVFLLIPVPVAVDAPVPAGAVPTGVVVVAFVLTLGVLGEVGFLLGLVLFTPYPTPCEAEATVAEVAGRIVAELALVLLDVEPPVSVIGPS